MNASEQVFGAPITRALWTDADTLILIYVGSAAEFALVPENHWLFYTNLLPSAPWKRFLETLRYNQKIFLSPADEVPALAEQIHRIHHHVERERSAHEGTERRISNEAYRAVGAMLIDFGIRAYQYLHRRDLLPEEKEQIFQDHRRFFSLMHISDLEEDFETFARNLARARETDRVVHAFTAPLFAAYRRELGPWRNWILLQFMAHFLPDALRERLQLRRNPLFSPAYRLYPRLRCPAVSAMIRWMYPREVRAALKGLASPRQMENPGAENRP